MGIIAAKGCCQIKPQGLRLPPIGTEYWKQPPDSLAWGSLMLLLLGVSLTYVGGMILNDAFDARWDAERRSTRPIPAGLITARDALRAGWGALAAGFVLTVFAAPFNPKRSSLNPPHRA